MMSSQTLCSDLGERGLELFRLREDALDHVQIKGFQEAGYLIAYNGTTITGHQDRFVLWRNTKWTKSRVLELVGQMLANEVNMQIGPAVDRGESAKNEKIKIINPPTEEDERVGLYIAYSNLMWFQIIDWRRSLGIVFPRHIRSE